MSNKNKKTKPTEPKLVAVIDRKIKQLSKIQVDLAGTEISSYDYNEISELTGKLKEYMINCHSYTGKKQHQMDKENENES